MRKSALIILELIFFNTAFVQEKNDAELKEKIYNENKAKVLNFSLKDFDHLFFEFSEKKSLPYLILTKEEFYKYTLHIAAFSNRLVKLYPDQKEMAEASKKKWFGESYEDYLLSKQSKK